MKLIFTSLIRILMFLIFPMVLFAQEKNNYSIRLHSGDFVPAENVKTISKNSSLLQNSLFGNKHFVTIQFYDLPDESMKVKIKAANIFLEDYIPNYAFTASIPSSINLNILASLNIRSIFQFTNEQKTVPALLEGKFPIHAINTFNTVDVNVVTYQKTDPTTILNQLQSLGAVILEDAQVFKRFTIRVPQANAANLVALPFVQWVEFVDPPNETENTLGRTLHRVNVLNDGVRNLKGDGINIGIWDSGEIGSHLDFSPAGRLTQVEFNSPSQHSTHCSGTILGRGLINPIARGMAPNAKLYSYNYNGNIQSEMAAGIPGNNLIVSSHSYGSTQTCGLNGSGVVYSNTSRETDLNLNNFPFHLHCHSSGNSQTACTGGWSTITSSGKSAKNNILVANITSTENLSGSSSCGPVQDGRVKPEISAFGTSVYSTSTPTNSYATLSGTSMATPGVAGTVSLLVQRYKQLFANALPPSALIKNTILNTAHDLGNPGPDYRFGYGRINALEAVKILEENRFTINTISTGAFSDMFINIPAGAAKLRVMLTWNDPAAAANANPALVNNLDLTVINGTTTTLPWILDPINPGNAATQGVDVVSNIEQVTINNPTAGNYTLRVTGLAVPVGSNQEYTLTWSVEMPHIEVTYPNGNESFNPGSSETITWNNAGVTGNQTVEYSLNNGVNWTTISTVSSSTSRLNWSIPSGANTSTALIRITSGSLTDMSDLTFKILGTPTGFSGNGVSCNAGEVVFNWTATTNATHYDISFLNTTTGEFDPLASNITGTTYTATGLPASTSMWFYLKAKNNTTGAISERNNAINVTTSGGGSGLGAIGSITGNNIICGATNGVPYSIAAVSGATSYTWTAPPGATIVTGQGTNNITVNYPGGSSSGNVTVYASNGSCQTTTVTEAITVNSSGVNAPLTGGDQTANVCSGTPVPTLIAAATVPSGHTIIWYSTLTGGNVVPTPSLNSIGVITYFAASRNTSTGCESANRTAVTLTINSTPPASVIASGPITFCQGGSVTLTANSGLAYMWSNGATTQSINVGTLGSTNYSVQVLQPGGCTSTSGNTTVVVNALPSAAISANGPLAFCEPGSVTLTASAGNSWLWSNGATAQSITISSPANSGAYTVNITNANGCSASSSATNVTVSPRPVVSLSASPYTSLYPGLNTTLTASVSPVGTYTYTWFKGTSIVSGANNASLPITLNDLGIYTVTVANAGGCANTSNIVAISDSATAKLFIMPNPNDGQFQVSYYSASNTSFTMNIFDSKGALVFSKFYNISTPYQRMDVDIRKHNAGIYTVVIIDKTGKRLATGGVMVY